MTDASFDPVLPESAFGEITTTDLVPAARVAELQQQLGNEIEEHSLTLSKLHAAEARADAVDRLDAKVQHVLETVVRLRANAGMAAAFGYELGHDDAESAESDARALAAWLVSLDDVDGPGAEARRTVTLTQIINRARAALGQAADAQTTSDRSAR